MTPRIHVLIPSFNCGEWIARCLGSVAVQHHEPEGVLLIDDASTDKEYTTLAVELTMRLNYTFTRNRVNQKCPYNLWAGIDYLDERDRMDADDVIFLLDGDDFLPNPKVFSRIAEVYADPAVWLTYGNYMPHPHDTGQTLATAYPPEVIAAKSFRRHNVTCFNHPITFRKHLWDRLTLADLKKANGEWFRGGYDLVIMMPMLELSAPSHFRFLDETLYAYNAVNPLSDSHANRDLVDESREILSRPIKR